MKIFSVCVIKHLRNKETVSCTIIDYFVPVQHGKDKESNILHKYFDNLYHGEEIHVQGKWMRELPAGEIIDLVEKLMEIDVAKIATRRETSRRI